MFLETPLPDESNHLHNSGWQSKASVKASCGANLCKLDAMMGIVGKNHVFE